MMWMVLEQLQFESHLITAILTVRGFVFQFSFVHLRPIDIARVNYQRTLRK